MSIENSVVVVRPGEGRALPGIIFKIYARETRGAFSVVEHPIPPRILIPPHSHQDADQVTYVLEGSTGMRIGDDEVLCDSGAYVVKPRGITHTLWNPTDAPARVMEITTPGSFEGFFEGLGEVFGQPGPDRGLVQDAPPTPLGVRPQRFRHLARAGQRPLVGEHEVHARSQRGGEQGGRLRRRAIDEHRP